MKVSLDHGTYKRNFCSCEKKAWKEKNPGLYGIRTHDICYTRAALLPTELASQVGTVGLLAQLVRALHGYSSQKIWRENQASQPEKLLK